jgi:NDP-sugar pyrophosphorylase family protein
MILHQVEALAAAGVTDIVLAVNYRPEIMEKHLAEVRGSRYVEAFSRELIVCSTRKDLVSKSPSLSNQNHLALQDL